MSQFPCPRSERSTAPAPPSRAGGTVVPSWLTSAAIVLALWSGAQPVDAAAQAAAHEARVLPTVTVPDFWNPRSRGERVEAPQTGRAVRFLTDDEFPPLHFAGPDGTPTGFVVELARAVCEKLAIPCTVQARRFDTLLDALDGKQGDVVAAAIPLTATLREKFLATRPYFRWPASPRGPTRACRSPRRRPWPNAASG